jgi:predicted metal-binding membrane protein
MDVEIVIPRLQAWHIFDLVLVFVMGLVIMVPRAARLVLMFASVNRRRHDQERPLVPTGKFSPDA